MSLTLTSISRRAPARCILAQGPSHQISAVSPPVIADRLITLAQETERAGYRETAAHLVELAYGVFDENRIH